MAGRQMHSIGLLLVLALSAFALANASSQTLQGSFTVSSMSRNGKYLILHGSPQAIVQPAPEQALLMYTFDVADSWTVISVDTNGNDVIPGTSSAVSDNGQVIFSAAGATDVQSVFLRASPSGPTKAVLQNPYEGSSLFTVFGISADGSRSLISVMNQTRTSCRIYNNADGSIAASLPDVTHTCNRNSLSSDGRYVVYNTLSRLNDSEPVDDYNQDIYLFDLNNPSQRVLLSNFLGRFDTYADCNTAVFLPNSDIFRFTCIKLTDGSKLSLFGTLSDPFNLQNRTRFYGWNGNDGQYIWSRPNGASSNLVRTDSTTGQSIRLYEDFGKNDVGRVITNDPEFLWFSADGNRVVFTLASTNVNQTTYPYGLNQWGFKLNIFIADIATNSASILMQPDCKYRDRSLCYWHVPDNYQWYRNLGIPGIFEGVQNGVAFSADGNVAAFTTGETVIPGASGTPVAESLGWIANVTSGGMKRVMVDSSTLYAGSIIDMGISGDGRMAVLVVNPSPFTGCDSSIHIYDVVNQILSPMMVNSTVDGPLACVTTSSGSPVISADGNYIAWVMGSMYSYDISRSQTVEMSLSAPPSYPRATAGGRMITFADLRSGSDYCLVNFDGTGERCNLITDVNGDTVASLTNQLDMSGDGRYISFCTYAQILPYVPNILPTCYVKDLVTNRTTAILRAADGLPPSPGAPLMTSSSNGQYWIFGTNTNFVVLHDHYNNVTTMLPEFIQNSFTYPIMASDAPYFAVVTEISLDYRDINAIRDVYRCSVTEPLSCQPLSVAPGFFAERPPPPPALPPVEPPVDAPVESPVEAPVMAPVAAPATTVVSTGEPPSIASSIVSSALFTISFAIIIFTLM